MGAECTSAQGCCSQMIGANEIVTAKGNSYGQMERIDRQSDFLQKQNSLNGRTNDGGSHTFIQNNVNILHSASNESLYSATRQGQPVRISDLELQDI